MGAARPTANMKFQVNSTEPKALEGKAHPARKLFGVFFSGDPSGTKDGYSYLHPQLNTQAGPNFFLV